MGSLPGSPPQVAAEPEPRRSRMPEAIAAVGVALGLVAAGLLGVRLLWPTARVEAGGPALARVEIAPFGEHVAAASVALRSGHWVRAEVRAGRVRPLDELAAGSRITVELTIRRSSWLGWLVGDSEHLRLSLTTPGATPRSRLLYPAGGTPVVVHFSAPVSEVSIELAGGGHTLLHLRRPREDVPLGLTASGPDLAGSALVAGAVEPWERIPPPVRVTWFPPAVTPEVLVRPRPRSMLLPTTPIVLTFSEPVSSLLGARRPLIWPLTPGTWHEPNDHTLVFQPSGLGFSLGAQIRLGLTRPLRVLSGADPLLARTLSWRVPSGSPRRLDQILAQLDYLPLRWRPAAAGSDPASDSPAMWADAALDPPSGSFEWRRGEPPTLRALWSSPVDRPVLVRGAIMAFESVHGLPPDGVPSPRLWRALLRAEIDDKVSPYGYTYVFVTENLPETLTLWHNGRVVLRTPVNTGIPGRATTLGTYPVYLHLASTTMSGTNPDGTHYSDPDVPWVNYFNGGDAVHGFVRSSYGYPQSLGCVEAPVSTAAVIWPYVQVGTLVTVVA